MRLGLNQADVERLRRSASAVSAVDKLIAESPVAVFSKSYCPYCRSAKETLAGQFKPAQIKVSARLLLFHIIERA